MLQTIYSIQVCFYQSIQPEGVLNGISHIKEDKISCSANIIASEELKENICQLVMFGNIWILTIFFSSANLAKLNGRRKSLIRQLGKFKDLF